MKRLLPLLFTVFIDSLGFGLVLPIFSPLIINNQTGMFAQEVSLGTRGLVFGLLIAAFCIGQFFGSPLLGSLSDRLGRKKVLLATLWLGIFAYFLCAMGIFFGSIAILLLARLISGLAAGNYTVAQSVIADVSKEKEKTKNFGLIGMAWGAGFIVGPYVGGKCVVLGLTAPFWVAAFLCLLALAGLYCWLDETFPVKEGTKIDLFAAPLQLKKAFALIPLRGVFIVMFVFSLGWGFFTEFSPVFLIRYFGFNLEQIANFYAWIGLWVALCQGLLIRPFLKRFSSENLLTISLIALFCVLPILLWLNGSVTLFWLIPLIALSEALIMPCASTLVSNFTSKENQGEVLGIYNSVQWAAIGITPLFSGSLVALYPHLPVTFSSACMLIAFLLAVWLFKKKVVKEDSKQNFTE